MPYVEIIPNMYYMIMDGFLYLLKYVKRCPTKTLATLIFHQNIQLATLVGTNWKFKYPVRAAKCSLIFLHKQNRYGTTKLACRTTKLAYIVRIDCSSVEKSI